MSEKNQLSNEELLARQQEQFENYKKEQASKSKKRWLWGCGGCLLFLIIGIVIVFALTGAFFKGVDEELNGTQEEQKEREENANKTFKVGDSIKGDGVTYTLESVEYASASGEFATEPDNGTAIKVNLSFKNDNEDQVLVDSADFSMKVNGENFNEWFGSDDTNSGFSHQLNKNNTANGYIYYDVPESDTYTLELDAMPNFNNVKGKWEIQKSDIE
ncbi:DUF4352 domain-containing protein [Staphylococcus chromogenes]|uniref:DUF4352 domain-containing protein n=1 Tax=Staphylococcus chromogenes TaxID=46126 RepID=UPI0028880CDE|nr:DUF4352 domain-containing protein [Staphylococcus chromogenes]MDT0715411.1 DUF4352 domain-containing protein [Staphylococcus chromogenes]MDT0750795.1 DUF4352 domain-containing protein [Staphylococcus chromogenes]